MIKNVFFVFIVTVVGILNSLLGSVSAKPQPQPDLTANLGNIALMPNAVTIPEKLHQSANLSYKVKGVRYYPKDMIKPFTQVGLASWYGKDFHGRLTSSGERYDMYEMTAAHKTLPIPSYVRVTNLVNHRTIIVRINDRGPFHSHRIIDLSYAAAKKLGFANSGVAKVRIDQIIPKSRHKINHEYSPQFIALQNFTYLFDAQNFMQKVHKITAQTKKYRPTVSLIANNQGYYQVRIKVPHGSKQLSAIKQLLADNQING